MYRGREIPGKMRGRQGLHAFKNEHEGVAQQRKMLATKPAVLCLTSKTPVVGGKYWTSTRDLLTSTLPA